MTDNAIAVINVNINGNVKGNVNVIVNVNFEILSASSCKC